jgi:hypothetical protein
MKLGKQVNKEDVIRKIRNVIEKDNSILFAYLHGSFLESNNYNDIDVAIYLQQEKGLTPLVMQKNEFKLSSMLEQKYRNTRFDVRTLNLAPPSFKYQVIKNGLLLFTKDEERLTDFEMATIPHYLDFSIYRKRYLREVLSIGD